MLPEAAPPADPSREGKAAKAARFAAVLAQLKEGYPKVAVPLAHGDPVQLLVATILSAQCTDAMVNRVTPALFARFPGAPELAGAPREEVEALIRPTGFFRQKARAIQETCRMLVAEYGGELPRTLAELTRLPGVGRKTANVILSAARLEGWPGWGEAADGLGFVVDTHVGRVTRRLGFTLAEDPAQVERDLLQLSPPSERATLPLRLIYFGRNTCTARRPRCGRCPLLALCPAGYHHGGHVAWATRAAPAPNPSGEEGPPPSSGEEDPRPSRRARRR